MPPKTISTNVLKIADENSEYHKLSPHIHVKIAPDTFIHTVANHSEITGLDGRFSLVANYDLYTIARCDIDNIGCQLFQAAMAAGSPYLPVVYLHDILPGSAALVTGDSGSYPGRGHMMYSKACQWAIVELYNPNVYKNVPYELSSLLQALREHRETLVKFMISGKSRTVDINKSSVYYALESVVTRGHLPTLEEYRAFKKEFQKDFDGQAYYWDFCRTRFNISNSIGFRKAVQKAHMDIREGHLMTREVIP